MSWALLVGVVLALGIGFVAALQRRVELARMEDAVRERERSVRVGADRTRLRQPVVDLSRCLGCATCVSACPEGDVLAVVHGQAVVVNGAGCVGHGRCEAECPVGAITVTLANLERRNDVPALDDALEAVGTRGLFLAGEVTAHALIRTAIEHGTSVAREVARRVSVEGWREDAYDLVIVGAGPAGLACSLEAKRLGLTFLTLEQASTPGGTVAKYPRRKLVLTEPVELPLVGQLGRREYEKEELVELWERAAYEHELPIVPGQVLRACEPSPGGGFVVRTQDSAFRARNVCLALGRRGLPRKLGVPGEDLPKVASSLLDASSFQGRRVLVVGGGDSAVEAALGLAEQPGNHVVLSHRRDELANVRKRNRERLGEAAAAGRVQVARESRVLAIHPGQVELEVGRSDARQTVALGNDDVFVMAGGEPPFALLEAAGVSFDPELRPVPEPVGEQGTGIVRALGIGFAFALVALLFAVWHADYYALPAEHRPTHEKHPMLRPGLGLGLAFGVVSTILVLANLAYLVRRHVVGRFAFGSLRSWMTLHVAAGVLAFLCAALHAALAPRDTVGGKAFWLMALLIATGMIGRYLYAYVPRAANGRELELSEAKARLARMLDAFRAGGGYERSETADVTRLIEHRRWRATFAGRLWALVAGQVDLRRTLLRLTREGRRRGLPREQVRATVREARRAHALALTTAHVEDLRALLSTWRWVHRWATALFLVFLFLHVVFALVYGAHLFEGSSEVAP